MKGQLIIFFTFLLSSTILFGQFSSDKYSYSRKLDLKHSNTWAIGGGVSQFIMHGDLRSIGTGEQGDFFNFGGYVYVDKMFNPLLGLELKANYNNMAGAAQYFSDIYDILYVSNAQITNNLFFEGRSFGAELNLIFSFSNIYETIAKKWHFSGYFGVGYHQYNSALYQRNSDGSATKLVDFGFNPARNSVNEASSIYLTTQFGVKRRVSKRVDIEFRPSWYFNYEDHLDATISNKQNWETFFVLHLGVAVKLGKNKVFTIWGDEEGEKEDANPFKIIDTDNDGVIDDLDKEPNTPKGVLVYGNGVSIDSDGDGLPDYKDNCKFISGPITNNGCPIKEVNEKKETVVEYLNYTKNIYFDTGSNEINNPVYYAMLDEAATILLNNPNVMFTVSGYTDNVGDEKKNQLLSEKRAKEARLYLIAKGVEKDRITAKGYGEVNPTYDNSTKYGRQLNRRVEIKSVGQYTKKKKVVKEED